MKRESLVSITDFSKEEILDLLGESGYDCLLFRQNFCVGHSLISPP